jgi:acetylornithine deacetylase/succinyl-diaminopimelate desuccinylase-like protein
VQLVAALIHIKRVNSGKITRSQTVAWLDTEVCADTFALNPPKEFCPMSLDAVLSRIDSDLPQALERLKALLRIPSISTDPAYKADCDAAADWLVRELNALGVPTEKRPTPGHPMVVGHIDGPGPHLLFYGHYDVQPVDPLELWHNDPFDPKIEDTPKGRVIRGRGTADDKGQLMTFVEACRAWKAEHGTLPCKITFFFEGEEESGSPSLVPFMQENADELRADLALICDTGLFESKVPGIEIMLRGMLQEEVIITGPDIDLHSGLYGGLAINPIRVLSRIIASLHDDEGRVTVPGFYDGVTELPDQVRSQWQALGFDHATFLGDVGLSHPAGEQDRTPLEMIWSRPTCEVNGISGGYAGAGFKTVLPSKASAKISFRLVGDQDPLVLRKSFREMVTNMLPPDCKVEFVAFGAGKAFSMETGDARFDAARTALTEEWGVPAAYTGSGGSIPIAGHFQSILGIPPMLIGFGKDDDGLHSPNEKYDVESFHKGTRSWARILAALT